MANITIQQANDTSVWSDGTKSAIVAPFGIYTIAPKHMTLGGLQRRVFNLVNENTITTAKKQFCGLHVFLMDIKIGEIRKIDGRWGWRMRSGDALYSTKEEAAIAYAKWAIANKWATSSQGTSLCDRFQGVA